MNDGTRTHDNRDHNPGLYQLSYAHHKNFLPEILMINKIWAGTPGRIRTCYPRLRRPMLYPDELRAQIWSGWRDSNPRHPAPKAGALPDCATPRITRPKDRAQILLGDFTKVNILIHLILINFIFLHLAIIFHAQLDFFSIMKTNLGAHP